MPGERWLLAKSAETLPAIRRRFFPAKQPRGSAMSSDYEKPIGPWARRQTQGVVHKITADELARWIVHVDERVIVINKSGELPCHPSKDGPWSSLAGAVRH